MKDKTGTIRTYMQDRQRIKDLKRELSVVQKCDISEAEIIRRTLNIPQLRKMLLDDAEIKRMRGKNE